MNSRIGEVDETGNLRATYLIESSEISSKISPVTIIEPPHSGKSTTYLAALLGVFLPIGYPHSVSEDYLRYQIYDSLQAFSSSIAGLLSSRAVLQGVGVGDANASPTAALLFNVLQDSMGRIATILFAHRLGKALEPECKRYRLAADVFNDSAVVLDCLSPIFSRPMRVGLLSLSSVLRALCGVAAGSSKASLSAHFAKWGNLAELNAKDSSQETVISLMGMLVGSLVVSHIVSPVATWISLIALLIVHMTTNYLAVRAVNLRTLNRQRANIVFSSLVDDSIHILTPSQVSRHERIFEQNGILRWKASSKSLGRCRIGVSFKYLADLIHSPPNSHVSTCNQAKTTIAALLRVFEQEEYIFWFDSVSRRGAIVLKTDVTPVAQLKAWSHALIVARHLELQRRMEKDSGTNHADGNDGVMLRILRETLISHSSRFDTWIPRLRDVGWDVDIASLETEPGRRLAIRKQE